MNAGPKRLTDILTATARGRRTTSRGQSEVIAVVLLISIVILGVIAVVVGSTVVLGEMQQSAEVSAAENSMSAFDSELSTVALGNAQSSEMDLGLRSNDGDVYYEDESWLRIDVQSVENGDKEVVNATLGTVVYTNGDTTVASEGGGVWRSDGAGSVMLSRPEFHYRDGTLTVPIVAIDGETGLTNDVQVTQSGDSIARYPNATLGFENQPDEGTVTVTVRSEYYEAWGRYFEQDTDGIVTYDHAKEQVTVLFIVLPERNSFDAGIIATSSNGELAIAGTGAYVNSYDSSEGNYSETRSADGLIQSAGDFKASGNSLVDGDVKADGVVTLQGSTYINGSLWWSEPPEPTDDMKAKVAGDVDWIDTVPTVDPIDPFIGTVATEVEQNNDNDAAANITANELSVTGTETELHAGMYYLNKIELSDGERLVVNTTDGDVTLVVRDYVKLTRGAEIIVEGDGVVHVFMQSENETVVSPTGLGNQAVNFHVGKNAAVDVPEERSSQMQVYGTSDFVATIAGANSGKARFVGLLYAPAGDTGPGYIYVKQGDMYGLAVTGNLTVGQYGAAHYDYGLRTTNGIGSPFSTLEAMHVTEHQVRVASGS